MIAILRKTLADKLSGDDKAVVDNALGELQHLLVAQATPTRDCDHGAAVLRRLRVVGWSRSTP